MKKTKLREIQEIAAEARYRQPGMSQYKMAKQIGVSPAYLSLVLHGERALTAVIYEYFIALKDAKPTRKKK